MRKTLLAVLAISSAGSAQVAVKPGRFDRLDRDSRRLLETIRCSYFTGQLRESGALGKLDSLGERGVCFRSGEHQYSVMLSTDSAITRVTRFTAIDMAARRLTQAPVDTAGALSMLRALDAGTERGLGSYQKANQRVTALAFRTDGDSIAVWFIPATNRPMLGGMRGLLYTPDGRTLAGEADDFAALRPLSLPDTGTVVITSSGDSLPTMSEMAVANSINEMGRRVRIETKTQSSTLAGAGAAAMWIHITKKP